MNKLKLLEVANQIAEMGQWEYRRAQYSALFYSYFFINYLALSCKTQNTNIIYYADDTTFGISTKHASELQYIANTAVTRLNC